MEDIKTLLNTMAAEKKVKILYACETGSRAWGFPSPDSDFDIRFIYVHEKDWYLSLAQKKDTIEYMDGDFDVAGWDLKKSLKLLKKSNAPLIERFSSPVSYFEADRFKENFSELVESYYSPTAVFFHHYSLAQKFSQGLKDSNEFKLKSYFYLVRSLLSCNWIARDSAVLPMHLEGLMKYIDDDQKTILRKLVQLKATVGEKYLHPKDPKLGELVTFLFEHVELAKGNLAVNKMDISLLDKFFLKMLHGKADN